MFITDKQRELLKIIYLGNPDGTCVDLNQLIERASYAPSKESMHFSVRALVRRELIHKAGRDLRRGRKRITFALLGAGMAFIAPVASSTFITTVEEDAEYFAEEI